jgi:hypothetical protein
MSIISVNPLHRLPDPKSQTAAPGPDCVADDPYDELNVEGWTVRVNQRLSQGEPQLCAKAMELLKFQLYQVTREVPKPALAKIRDVVIWVELDDKMFPGLCYHPDRHWLGDHGLNPDKAHGVEIANAQRFLDWEHRQPWMVLHELAHAYHNQFLPGGFDNDKVRAAYQNAKSRKLYEAVLRNNGHTERAYAMTDPMEYFAECSEAYFGTNDFYPFVRVELKAHDPQGYETLTDLWGMNDGPTSRPATQPAR